MKKSEWLDCQGNEFFPKQKGTPSLVKIEHNNTATLDSARSKKKSKVAVLQLSDIFIHTLARVIFWFNILNFNIFGVFRKINIFWGMKILWIFFGGHHKIGLYLCVISMHFRVFS